MAAPPYMPLFVADYLADTMHLSTEEHGAYLLLIMHYWRTGKPLDGDPDRLAAIARLPNDRWQSVATVVQRLFNIRSDGTWTHDRIDAELQRADARIQAAKRAGRASAKSRLSAKQQLTENHESTPVERPLVSRSNVEPTTSDIRHKTSDIRQEDNKTTRAKARAVVLRPPGVDQQVWDDFVAHRKAVKAPITETALAGFEREAERAGMSLTDALRVCLERGWRGFRADWIASQTLSDPKGRVSPVTLKTMQNLREYLE